MVAFILPANSASSGGYEIDNSLRFWNGDYLKDTTFGTGTNLKKFTFSYWIKPTDLDTGGNPSLVYSNDSNDHIGFDGDNKFIFADSGSIILKTNRVFRDVSAWYHIVLAVDTTQGTAGNRYKLYVNGTQETSLATDAGINQNTDLNFHNNETHSIGRNQNDGTDFLYAYLAEFHAIDGQQLDASYFGETNDNGVWIPKEYTGTYGNNGMFMEFKQSGTGQSSSSMGADTSGNDNHFVTVALAATNQTTDTPTNNFCTLNLVDNDGIVTSEGNCNFDTSSGSNEGIRATIGVQNGKWYYECKITNSAGLSAGNIGYANPVMQLTENPRGGECAVINGSSSIDFYNNNSSASTLDASNGIGQNDIVGVALDLDSSTKTIQFFKNGSAIASAQTVASGLLNDFLLPCMFDDGGANDVVGSFNFGNPTFSGTDKSDANGFGSFEYTVPSGYFALCTKNLAEYG